MFHDFSTIPKCVGMEHSSRVDSYIVTAYEAMPNFSRRGAGLSIECAFLASQSFPYERDYRSSERDGARLVPG